MAEEPVETPDGSQTTTDPNGETETGETPDGSQTTPPEEVTPPDDSQSTDPSGSGDQTNPDGSQSGGQTPSEGGQTPDSSASQGGDTPSGGDEESAPPSQDISGGASAQGPATGEPDGLTVTDLPSWLNPTGAEPAA